MCGCGINGNMINTGNTGNGQGGGLTVNDVNTLITNALANFTSGLPVLSGWNPSGTIAYVEPVADAIVGATVNIVSDTISIAEPNAILPDLFNGQAFGYYVGYQGLNYKNPTGGNGYSDLRFKVPALPNEPFICFLGLHSGNLSSQDFVDSAFNNTNIGYRFQIYFLNQGNNYYAGYSVYTQNALVEGGGFSFPNVGDDIIIRLYDNGTIGQIINDTTQQVIANINNFALGALDLGLTATFAVFSADNTTSIVLEYDISHGLNPFTEISSIPNPPPNGSENGGGLVPIIANGSYDNKNLQIGDYVLFYNGITNIVVFRLPSLTEAELINLINQSIVDSLDVGNPAYNAILALFNTGAILYNTVEAIAQNAALSIPSLTAQQHFDLNKKIASIQNDHSIALLPIYTVLIVGQFPVGELTGFSSGQCVMVVDNGSGGKIYTGVTAEIGQRYYLESESLYLVYDPYNNFTYESVANIGLTLPDSWRIDFGIGSHLRTTQTHNLNQAGFEQINVDPMRDALTIININASNTNNVVVVGNFSSDLGQKVCAEGVVILRNNTNEPASLTVLFDGTPNVYGDFNNADILNSSTYTQKTIDTYGHIVLKWIKSKTSFFVDFKVFYTLDDQQYFNKPRLPFESFNAGDYNISNALILPPYARVCFINGSGSNYLIQANVSRNRIVYDEVTLKFAENNANVTMPDGTIKSPQSGESYSYVNINGQYVAI